MNTQQSFASVEVQEYTQLHDKSLTTIKSAFGAAGGEVTDTVLNVIKNAQADMSEACKDLGLTRVQSDQTVVVRRNLWKQKPAEIAETIKQAL